MRKTQVVTSLQELQALRPAWESVYRVGEHTMFQSFSWNYLAAQVFTPGSLYLVYSESQNGAAIIPSAVEDSTVCFLGDDLFDYRDVLACGDQGVLREAWNRLAKLGLPLCIRAVRGQRLEHWRTVGFVPQPFASAPQVRPSVCSAEDFTAYHRRAARCSRRITRAGARLRCYSGSASPLIRRIYEGKAANAAEGNLFSDRVRVEFMVAAAALDPFACEIFTFEAGPAFVAALVTFRDGAVRRFYTIDYARNWASYSPGVALVYEVTCRSLAAGMECDYMTGEHPYKMRFATSAEPLFSVQASAEELRRVTEYGEAA